MDNCGNISNNGEYASAVENGANTYILQRCVHRCCLEQCPHNILERWVYIDDSLMDMPCCLLHSVGVCCTTMTAMAWWIFHAAYYTRWVYMLHGPTVIHLHETKCGSVLANRAINTGKEMVDEQITKFAVSLTTTLKPRRKLDEIIKSCEFQISLNRSWNFILWFAVDALSIFVGFRWCSTAC